jgi:membrane protease subunit (stomatin/prohibitin family)
MGIKDFLFKQFIDVIDWTESGPGVLSFRYPMQDREIQNGGKLVVTETQAALFVNEGKVADLFGPGTHTLATQNLPILTNLKNWDKAFASPFKSDVYFFSQREQTDQKWGTTNPISLRDPEFGPIRLRAHGVYSYKISDPKAFWTKLSGTTAEYTVEDCQGQLRAAILTSVSNFLATSKVPFLDMAANQVTFSESLKAAAAPYLAEYGLELVSFFVQNLSLPEEVEKHFDRATSMKVVGDMKSYTQFQAADSLTGAGGGDSAAQAGVGIGAGLAVGQMMAQTLQGAPSGKAAGGEDPLLMIEKLGELLKKGLLTQEEFDKKKVELLGKI